MIVGFADAATEDLFNEVNSTRARVFTIERQARRKLHAMAVAFTACEQKLGREIRGALLDGNQKAPLAATVVQRTLVGGDGLIMSIAAASIVAKVTRDRLMCALAQDCPGYGFESHKGYGTRQHQEALTRLGPTPLHRKSFAPVQLSLMAMSASTAVNDAALED